MRGAGRLRLAARWPWLVAFCFGLLHGFGFAGALAEVGLPHHAIPIALLFFNLGVEIGQLVFVAAVLSSIWLLRQVASKLWELHSSRERLIGSMRPSPMASASSPPTGWLSGRPFFLHNRDPGNSPVRHVRR